MFFFDHNKKIRFIKAETGVKQGDPTAPLVYAMAIHPMIQQIKQLVNNNALIRFYMDDANFAGSSNTLFDIITFLKNHGPKFGYYLKLNKGFYKLAECATP